jgi:hypothetical protein
LIWSSITIRHAVADMDPCGYGKPLGRVRLKPERHAKPTAGVERCICCSDVGPFHDRLGEHEKLHAVRAHVRKGSPPAASDAQFTKAGIRRVVDQAIVTIPSLRKRDIIWPTSEVVACVSSRV